MRILPINTYPYSRKNPIDATTSQRATLPCFTGITVSGDYYFKSISTEQMNKFGDFLAARIKTLAQNKLFSTLYTRELIIEGSKNQINFALANKCLDFGFDTFLSTAVLKYSEKGSDVSDLIKRLKDAAMEKIDLFKRAYCSNDENDLNRFFAEQLNSIVKTAGLLGETSTIYAYNLKFHRFHRLINEMRKYSDYKSERANDLLLTKINPQNCKEYKALADELKDLRILMFNEYSTDEFFDIYHKNRSMIRELENEIALLKSNFNPGNKQKINDLYKRITVLRREINESKSPEFISAEKQVREIKAKMNRLVADGIKDPQKKIMTFYLYNAFVNSERLTEDDLVVLDSIIDSASEPEKLNNFLKTKLHNVLDIAEKQDLLEGLNLHESPYYANLFTVNKAFGDNFKQLLEALNQDEPIIESLNKLPQNIETKEIFEKHSLNYDAWVGFDEEKDVLKDGDFTVRKVRMDDIKHSLFLGNQSSCCTAVGGIRGANAPLYIINKFIAAVEILNGENIIGNSLCYLANIEGKDSLVFDNVEVHTPYYSDVNNEDLFIKFGRKLAENLGQPDMPIYAGNRNKFEFGRFHLNSYRDIHPIGETGNELLYIDSLATDVFCPNKTYSATLYKLYPNVPLSDNEIKLYFSGTITLGGG